jgi:hypothetical protein
MITTESHPHLFTSLGVPKQLTRESVTTINFHVLKVYKIHLFHHFMDFQPLPTTCAFYGEGSEQQSVIKSFCTDKQPYVAKMIYK